MSDKIEEQVRLLIEKVDRVLALLEAGQGRSTRRVVPRTQKAKAEPLSDLETEKYRSNFERLFEIWDSGEELQVQKELEMFSVEDLRRFADANNLNVTAKMPKQKVMQLIAGRFRERRQLMRSHFIRRPME